MVIEEKKSQIKVRSNIFSLSFNYHFTMDKMWKLNVDCIISQDKTVKL